MRAKFSWKDHLRGIFGGEETVLRMRIKHLNAAGYGEENPMVQVLQRKLREISKEKPE